MTAKRVRNSFLHITEFAKMVERSPRAITKAIEDGRLRKWVTYVGGKPKIKRAHAKKAAAELRGNSKSITKRLNELPPEIKQARRDDELAKARYSKARAEMAELELAVRKGEFLLAAEVETRMTDVFLRCRSKLLGVPSRIRQEDPTLTREQLALVKRTIREALEDLAE